MRMANSLMSTSNFLCWCCMERPFREPCVAACDNSGTCQGGCNKVRCVAQGTKLLQLNRS